MLIKTISTVTSAHGHWLPGTVVDVHESMARPLLERGHAVLYEPEPEPSPEAAPEPAGED